jgi:hypothetical protein
MFASKMVCKGRRLGILIVFAQGKGEKIPEMFHVFKVGHLRRLDSCSQRLTRDAVRCLGYRLVQIQIMCYGTGDKGCWVYRS